MKKVVIIEDELLSATRLKKKILDIDDTLQVDGPLRSVKEVVDYFQSHDDYDLVFPISVFLTVLYSWPSVRSCRRRLSYSLPLTMNMPCRPLRATE